VEVPCKERTQKGVKPLLSGDMSNLMIPEAAHIRPRNPNKASDEFAKPDLIS